MKNLTKDEVKKQLKKLRTNKSCGTDKVHPYLLQKFANEMAIPLTLIYNISLNTGLVPSIWKEGITTAIYKKGDKSLPANYRAITLTSVVQCVKLWKKSSLSKSTKDNNLEDQNHQQKPPNSPTLPYMKWIRNKIKNWRMNSSKCKNLISNEKASEYLQSYLQFHTITLPSVLLACLYQKRGVRQNFKNVTRGGSFSYKRGGIF